MGGRWRYRFIVSLLSVQRLHCNDTQIMGGRWRYKIIVFLSSKYSTFTPHTDTQVMGGRWYSTFTPHTDTQVMGGRWLNKGIVSS